MNTDDKTLHGLDRAQLIKLGAAALLAAIGTGATEGEADADAHAMTTNSSVPLGLDFQQGGFGQHATRTHTRMGKELKRVRITTDKRQTHGSSVVHELDNGEIIGVDEDGHRHHHEYGSGQPMYVALWFE
jgi:hypothetical protein